jgi:hypothetical protein
MTNTHRLDPISRQHDGNMALLILGAIRRAAVTGPELSLLQPFDGLAEADDSTVWGPEQVALGGLIEQHRDHQASSLGDCEGTCLQPHSAWANMAYALAGIFPVVDRRQYGLLEIIYPSVMRLDTAARYWPLPNEVRELLRATKAMGVFSSYYLLTTASGSDHMLVARPVGQDLHAEAREYHRPTGYILAHWGTGPRCWGELIETSDELKEQLFRGFRRVEVSAAETERVLQRIRTHAVARRRDRCMIAVVLVSSLIILALASWTTGLFG